MKTDNFFLEKTLPFWNELSDIEKNYLQNNIRFLHADSGTLIHSNFDECLGVILMQTGRLRCYILSSEGREITLYYIDQNDLTMLSAACVLQNASLPLLLSAEEDSCLYVIPPHVYNHLRTSNIAVEHYTSEILGESFSETLAAMECVIFMSLEQRLALFLLEQSAFEQSLTIHITHENIAKQLGSAREVISRLLKQFAKNKIIENERKDIFIKDKTALKAIAKPNI